MFASASSPSRSRPFRCRPAAPAALAALAAIVVSGCAGRPVAELPELDSWERRQAVLAALDEWGFNGRIAVRSSEDGFNGKLRYAQTDGDFEATLSGPLGIGTVQLAGGAGDLVYTDKDGVETRFRDPDIELEHRFGWNVPLSSLRYWALGIPEPDRPAVTEFGESGRLASLQQAGWSVAFPRYRDAGGQAMPQRLVAENGDTRVTLVIDRWRIAPPR